MKVMALQGDTVDQLCARHYGMTAGVTEAVYLANPGLAELGAVLPIGMMVYLPEISTTEAAQEQQLINLWD
ncbi:tail protein X [Paludibacterium paludis]|uniref:Tail protein n=1 Tax=Paludibacterium paludis TaxID=1225769 RepID=A0A918NY90_9NEIS|nr:tail protein X [Paludibacterium paludis]GGY03870.1 tail protein [Paludibacterium paludis]